MNVTPEMEQQFIQFGLMFAPPAVQKWMNTPEAERGPVTQEMRDWICKPDDMAERMAAMGRTIGEKMAKRRDEVFMKAFLGKGEDVEDPKREWIAAEVEEVFNTWEVEDGIGSLVEDIVERLLPDYYVARKKQAVEKLIKGFDSEVYFVGGRYVTKEAFGDYYEGVKITITKIENGKVWFDASYDNGVKRHDWVVKSSCGRCFEPIPSRRKEGPKKKVNKKPRLRVGMWLFQKSRGVKLQWVMKGKFYKSLLTLEMFTLDLERLMVFSNHIGCVLNLKQRKQRR